MPANDYWPYNEIAGICFEQLAPPVKDAHRTPLSAQGIFQVERGTGRVARLLGALARLPRPGTEVLVTLEVVRAGDVLLWHRSFDGRSYRSFQRRVGDDLVEDVGPIRFHFRLECLRGSLIYRQRSVDLGRLRMPKRLQPTVDARVSDDPPGWRVDVRISHPFAGCLCHYSGRMVRV